MLDELCSARGDAMLIAGRHVPMYHRLCADHVLRVVSLGYAFDARRRSPPHG